MGGLFHGKEPPQPGPWDGVHADVSDLSKNDPKRFYRDPAYDYDSTPLVDTRGSNLVDARHDLESIPTKVNQGIRARYNLRPRKDQGVEGRPEPGRGRERPRRTDLRTRGLQKKVRKNIGLGTEEERKSEKERKSARQTKVKRSGIAKPKPKKQTARVTRSTRGRKV
ncbi:Hypothetical protein D9617_44g038940 [Elsinoe fawcettii]|nr:Hypothetical protein D9617_44g038940 [Elsinoe fawcettii]